MENKHTNHERRNIKPTLRGSVCPYRNYSSNDDHDEVLHQKYLNCHEKVWTCQMDLAYLCEPNSAGQVQHMHSSSQSMVFCFAAQHQGVTYPSSNILQLGDNYNRPQHESCNVESPLDGCRFRQAKTFFFENLITPNTIDSLFMVRDHGERVGVGDALRCILLR